MIPRTQVVTPGSRNARLSCNSAVGGGRMAMVPVALVGVILLRAVVCRRINFGTVLLRYGATCNPCKTTPGKCPSGATSLLSCRGSELPPCGCFHPPAAGSPSRSLRLAPATGAAALLCPPLPQPVGGPRSSGSVSLSGQSTTSLKSAIGHFG